MRPPPMLEDLGWVTHSWEVSCLNLSRTGLSADVPRDAWFVWKSEGTETILYAESGFPGETIRIDIGGVRVCLTLSIIWCLLHHVQSPHKSKSSTEWVPSCLFMWATIVVLSEAINTYFFSHWVEKYWRARITAFSSKGLCVAVFLCATISLP